MKSEGDKLRALRIAEMKARDKARLRALRAHIRELRRSRPARMLAIRHACREGRRRVREEVKRLREETRADLAARVLAMRVAERGTCEASKAGARAALEAALRDAERETNEWGFILKARYGRKKLAPGAAKARRAERRSESDDEVRHNIPAELVPVFDKMRGQIKPSDRRTRTEAFLQWVHDNEDEAHAVLYANAENDLARYMAEQSALERRLKSGYRSSDVRAASLAEVPF